MPNGIFHTILHVRVFWPPSRPLGPSYWHGSYWHCLLYSASERRGGEGPPPLVEVNQAILAWSFLNQYPQCDERITLEVEYTVYIVFRNPHDPGKGSI